MAAKLVIEFEKVLLAGPPELYYLHTTVEADSTPDDIRQCLVVEELGITEPEKILRIATFAEIPLLNSISIISQGVSNPIALTPAVGDRYIVKVPGEGLWAGHDNSIATRTGIATWTYIEAAAGMAAWVVDEQLRYVFGTSWVATPGTGLPELPVDVNCFEDAVLPGGTIQVGWTLRIKDPFPPIWVFAMGLLLPPPTDTLYYEVVSVLNPAINQVLVVPYGVTTAFPPTPERGLVVDYYDGVGVLQLSSITLKANRDFTGLPGTAYRISEHHDTFIDETVANNKVNSLQAQAHTLVQDTNEDTFTGTFTETFE